MNIIPDIRNNFELKLHKSCQQINNRKLGSIKSVQLRLRSLIFGVLTKLNSKLFPIFGINRPWLCVLFLFCFTSCEKKNPSKHDIEILSFHRGYSLWEELKQEPIPYAAEPLVQGLQAAVQGKKLTINEEAFASTARQFQERFIEQRRKENLHETELFLQKIAKNTIEVIPSKLYIKVNKQGEGKSIKAEDAPFIIYTVKTIEKGIETNIVSSEGAPIQIQLQDTIPGFIKGVIGMLEGEKRTLYIHPDLTKDLYSSLSNQILIMDVEIISNEAIKTGT
jgi:peptidylprolyl isomerase